MSITVSPWLTAREGSKYARMSYRRFLNLLSDGRIRSIKDGSRYLTRAEWIDECYEQLEDTGLLVRGDQK